MTDTMQPHDAIGLELMAERDRQIDQLGRGPAHDDRYKNAELARAAGALAIRAAALLLADRPVRASTLATEAAVLNPFPGSDLVSKQTDPRRALIEGGALLIAAVEHIDRAEARAKAKTNG